MEKLTSAVPLIENFRELYKTSLMADFEIKLENKTIRTHRAILGIRNSYFLDVMSSQPRVRKLEINDVKPEVFEAFIEFLYTGEVEKANVNNDLLFVAHKFCANELKQICEKHLVEQLQKADAIKTLVFAIEMNCKLLVDKSCSLIVQNYEELKALDEFQNLTFNHKASAAIFDGFVKKEKSMVDISRDASKLVIPSDLDGEVLKTYLKFLRTERVDPKEISKELLVLAIENSNNTLLKICENHFCTHVNHENAVELLNLATKYSLPTLSLAAMKHVLENFESKIFKEAAPELPILANFKNRYMLEVPYQNDVVTEVFSVNNVPLQIMLSKREHKSQESWLFFSLQCTTEVPMSCQITSTFKLISFTNPSEQITRARKDVQCSFSKNQREALSQVFISYTNLTDPKKGFVKDGKVQLQVDINVKTSRRKSEEEDLETSAKKVIKRVKVDVS